MLEQEKIKVLQNFVCSFCNFLSMVISYILYAFKELSSASWYLQIIFTKEHSKRKNIEHIIFLKTTEQTKKTKPIQPQNNKYLPLNP